MDTLLIETNFLSPQNERVFLLKMKENVNTITKIDQHIGGIAKKIVNSNMIGELYICCYST